jgi:hypothetical protein
VKSRTASGSCADYELTVITRGSASGPANSILVQRRRRKDRAGRPSNREQVHDAVPFHGPFRRLDPVTSGVRRQYRPGTRGQLRLREFCIMRFYIFSSAISLCQYALWPGPSRRIGLLAPGGGPSFSRTARKG